MLRILLLVLERFPWLTRRLVSAARLPTHLLVDLLRLPDAKEAALVQLVLGRPLASAESPTKWSFRLVEAQRLVFPRPVSYTCQWAFACEETLRVQRRFACFDSTEAYLSFFQAWSARQARSPTCLMECTSGNCPRKWVMDIDAPGAGVEEDQVVALATDACARLHAVGFAERTPGFALLTRHRSTKRSWHVVLLVLAPYAQWRSAMLAIDEALRAAHPSVSPFYDPAVLRNSKGQYMQTLHSCKPSSSPPKPLQTSPPNPLQTSPPNPLQTSPQNPLITSPQNPPQKQEAFRFAGLHIHNAAQLHTAAEQLHTTELLQTLTASMLLPDPFCCHCLATYHSAITKEIKKRSSETCLRQVANEGVTWDEVPAFAKTLLAGPATGLCRLQELRVQPSVVCDLVRRGTGKVIWFAEVTRPRLCPRALAHHRVVRTHCSNNLLALVVRETMPRERTTDRVFALCLSDKCLSAKLRDKQPTSEKGRWVELLAHMLLYTHTSLSLQRLKLV